MRLYIYFEIYDFLIIYVQFGGCANSNAETR